MLTTAWLLILCTPVQGGATCLPAQTVADERTCKAMIEEYRAAAGPVGGYAIKGRCFDPAAEAAKTPSN